MTPAEQLAKTKATSPHKPAKLRRVWKCNLRELRTALNLTQRDVAAAVWSGHTGTLVAVQKPSIGILPVMGRVLLDDAPDVPSGHECFVARENLQPNKVQP